MRRRCASAAALLLLAGLSACLPAGERGTLPPTLTIEEAGGMSIPMQNGIPVPSFSWQPRPRIDLDGQWRVEHVELDADLTMGDRSDTLAAIEQEAAGRQLADHDDADWPSAAVPGTTNPPPDGVEGGAWYRRAFEVPSDWDGRAVTIRFGSANYVADAWLNGTWLGYHEGGATPFAFQAAPLLLTGGSNVLAVRVHTIPLGDRSDTVPWGLIDWWNYGGLTGSVWLEAAPAVHVARADVIPHLDAVEVDVLVAGAAQLAGARAPLEAGDRDPPSITLSATILPASVTDDNLLDPDPRALVSDLAESIITVQDEVAAPPPGAAERTTLTIGFGDADLWSPTSPALYVLRVDLSWTDRPLDPREARPPDTFWTTFGIRHLTVDAVRPRVLLNGEAVFFHGVGLHAESLAYDGDGRLVGGTPAQSSREVLTELQHAAALGADLIRTGHQPGDPTMLMLADRLGFAVWEEVPIYHATPFIFERTMARGIPMQMLREMALRDMNHPSVMFHGLANESTGQEERADALAELHDADREIDGTRLTGQAAYGWNPADVTHAPLDVAGFTFYHGVFYGSDPGPDTRRALRAAHEANPDKPIMVLEFGRWADEPADEARQRVIFDETYAALERYRADEPTGFLSAATWWTLHDFATQIAGIEVEDFGLYRPDGTLRPAGERAEVAFDSPGGRGAELGLEPDLDRPRARPAGDVGDWALAGYLAYGLGLAVAAPGFVLFVLTRRGGRSVRRRR
jgi:beta-glucuronidase